MVRGSCLCGDVVWEASGKLERMSHCHCSMCRKAHGAAFATYVAAEGFRSVRGAESVRRYESSPGFFRSFCGRCGSVVPVGSAQGRVFMPVGPLDGDPGARPVAHMFAASKAPWHDISDDLPRFDAMPPGYDPPEIPARPEVVAEPGELRGSCLCGGVAYAIRPPLDRLVNCHCSRCQKARSAAHASNALAAAERFRWIRGAELVDAYKVPEAERFTHSFCRVCGSGAPRVFGSRVSTPAGSLDDDPGLGEQLHFFVTSKAPWYDITGDLPQYDEYPPNW